MNLRVAILTQHKNLSNVWKDTNCHNKYCAQQQCCMDKIYEAWLIIDFAKAQCLCVG